ncbi:predicted protein [Uncinocarpus reesii 1704]|uniref:Protein SIP5 n=1 Tax=Uncinocarpus reesii (strain UAMH 1704) TaxID=336963 RepID=C4JJ49_UNCRE|nr:uncharacterized protein UREG_01656 [Uncinocarpus reesii 1704]EEP76807.1 predicted protein [Uncinocarpus reesii 1704]
MGNTSTKECRPHYEHGARHSRGGSAVDYEHQRTSDNARTGSSSRTLLNNRPELAILGLTSDRDQPSVEHRRETRQEREARKREKENAARIKERERSMKEEHVDGAYLVTQGVYVGPEDYNKAIVRQLMIERRLAPFWKGLNDFSDSWTEHQLMAAARGMPIPAPDEVPPELEYKIPSKAPEERQISDRSLNTLMVPITSRSQSYNSDTSSINRTISPARSPGALSPTSSFFRGRAKTLASLTTSSKTNVTEMAPREIQLPKDPFVNGQPLEAYLYKDASECPICFLYYPPYLNKTRCCDQPICSECFVQIKRPDPHPPEHHDPNNSENNQSNEPDGQLVSEPAACPFCVQPEFGVTYSPPPFRRGLVYAPNASAQALANSSAASSASSLVSGGANPTTRRRAVSISADSPSVITTDKVRPDWATKLAAARAQAARRSAAATALHTAAYLINTPGASGEPRRRSMLRRTAGQDSPISRTGSPHINALAYLAERRAIADRENESPADGSGNRAPGRTSSRRSRIDELEEMMMMEAIRLSLAAEEERRKKEEKEAKKEAKRRGKEAKKAEKHARKSGLYSNNPSNIALNVPSSSATTQTATKANLELDKSSNKGKGVDRSEARLGAVTETNPSIEPSKLASKDTNCEQTSATEGCDRRTHLRHVSSASSSSSSLVESAFGESIGSRTPHNGSSSNLAPIHGFRSLAAMIDDTTPSESAENTNHPGSSSDQTISSAVAEQPDDPLTAESGRPTPLSPPPLDRKDTLGKEADMSSTEVLPQSKLGTAS